MLAPFLAGAGLLVLLPLGLTFALAFMRYDALSAPSFRGLANFHTVLQQDLFGIALANSALFVALAVPLRLAGALALALLLNRRRCGMSAVRTAVYLPTVIPDIAYAFIWLWIFNPLYGPLNQLLAWAHLPTPAWLVDSRTALPSLVLMSLFQLGEGMVVLWTGQQHTPAALYQAAGLDGASRWQQLRHITLPLLTPWLLLLAVRDVIYTAQSTFAPALIMTGGGPYYATLFVPLLVYQEAFDRFRFGEAAAMTVVSFGLVGVAVYAIYRLAGGWGYGDEL